MIQRRSLVTALALALSSTTVFAAELEEIIVTAQHREQNVQDVPITVSALDA